MKAATAIILFLAVIVYASPNHCVFVLAFDDSLNILDKTRIVTTGGGRYGDTDSLFLMDERGVRGELVQDTALGRMFFLVRSGVGIQRWFRFFYDVNIGPTQAPLLLAEFREDSACGGCVSQYHLNHSDYHDPQFSEREFMPYPYPIERNPHVVKIDSVVPTVPPGISSAFSGAIEGQDISSFLLLPCRPNVDTVNTNKDRIAWIAIGDCWSGGVRSGFVSAIKSTGTYTVIDATGRRVKPSLLRRPGAVVIVKDANGSIRRRIFGNRY